jgi:hypothetical protein
MWLGTRVLLLQFIQIKDKTAKNAKLYAKNAKYFFANFAISLHSLRLKKNIKDETAKHAKLYAENAKLFALFG